MVSVTASQQNLATKYGATRWLCMKYVGVWCLEQWQNLTRYFLQFLPRQPTFKSTVAGMNRYKRIRNLFQMNTTEAYISFMVFAIQDFEAFLCRFQFEQPMIHLLYLAIVELILKLMTKFVQKKFLVSEDGTPKPAAEILAINVQQASITKNTNAIDIGTRAKMLLANGKMFPDEVTRIFQCLKFYQVATQYLLNNLPHDKSAIKPCTVSPSREEK